MSRTFRKNAFERWGSLFLIGSFFFATPFFSWSYDGHNFWIRGLFICLLSVLYAWYERVTVTDAYVVHQKLSLVIPQKSIVMGKHIQDVRLTTIVPGFHRIEIMTGNDKDVAIQYFERSDELVAAILDLAG